MPINIETLQEWYKWKETLIESKAMEMKLRKEICAAMGENDIILGNYEYRSRQGVNRSIDASALEAIWDELSQEEKDCIHFSPKVSYARIPSDSILWDIITEKPATPTLARLEIGK